MASAITADLASARRIPKPRGKNSEFHMGIQLVARMNSPLVPRQGRANALVAYAFLLAHLNIEGGAIGPTPILPAEQPPVTVSTNKIITPTAAHAAIFQEFNPSLPAAPNRRGTRAGAMAASPNGKRLAILTSGFPVYYDAEGKLVPEVRSSPMCSARPGFRSRPMSRPLSSTHGIPQHIGRRSS
jgi:hypothetical protein